ncbi:MAG: carboxypeptidase-like regulatory domain-containing protein, partial [Flavobacteriales bacterium]|nr:carboxypeptidase-like regulatory domain-containing protein [Flavobacteriales bacterium]
MISKKSLSVFILSGLLLISVGLFGQEVNVEGKVFDASNNSPLSFATVSLKGDIYGVTCDERGYFKMTLPLDRTKDTISINYVGFKTFELEVREALQHYEFRLESSVLMLDEVIVRPRSAENYLRKVMRKLSNNYAKYSFNTSAHYEEVIKENSYPIDHSEAVFRSWFQDFQEKGRSDHQLILFRENETNELVFMRSRAEKEKQKYLAKNPDKAEQYDENDILLTNFGGPSSILNLNVMNGSLDCLDTTIFQKFKFSFLPETSYEGNRLIVLAYESKGTLDNRRQQGKLFIDSNSDAIVKV